MSKEIRIVEVEGHHFSGGFHAFVTTIAIMSDGSRDQLTQPIGRFKTRDEARATAINFILQTTKGE